MIIPSAILGGLILISYVGVIGNGFNRFPVPESENGYFSSPWWLGIRRESAMAITIYQLFAAAGAITWFLWVAREDSFRGPLASPLVKQGVVYTFLISSALWPYLAHPCIQNPHSIALSVLACIPLIVAAVCIILAVAFTFESRAPPLPTIGILQLGLIVVLADGVGWTASCMYTAIHKT